MSKTVTLTYVPPDDARGDDKELYKTPNGLVLFADVPTVVDEPLFRHAMKEEAVAYRVEYGSIKVGESPTKKREGN